MFFNAARGCRQMRLSFRPDPVGPASQPTKIVRSFGSRGNRTFPKWHHPVEYGVFSRR